MGEISERAASQLDLHGNQILNFPLRNSMSEMRKYIVPAYEAVSEMDANAQIWVC